MAGPSETFWLIVEPAPSADARVEGLVSRLAPLGLDPYNARQRLIGHGPALLARAVRPQLEKAAALLDEHDFSYWIVRPTPPAFSPQRITGVDLTADAVVFYCREKRVPFPRGASVLAILADLSGEVAEKNLKRLLRQNAYRGAAHVSHLAAEELQQAILRASPVLDLYLLSAEGGVKEGVRVFAGRFDPSGLGKRATYSAAGNLQAILEVVRERAGEFTLRTDFGSSALPGCRPEWEHGGEESQRHNLAALTRFGWLMADLQGMSTSEAPPKGDPLAALAPAAAPSASPPPPESLPLPPHTRGSERDFATTRLRWISAAFATLVVPLFWFDEEVVWHYGVRTGALPAFFALLLLLAGFQMLAWKRRIENTPTSRVRSLAMGAVEVHGRAVRRYALVSPMTQMACVWYRLRRYRRDRNGWKLTSTLSSGAVSFYLDDGTGRVCIEPRGAVVRSRTRQEGRGHFGSDERWVEDLIYEGTSLYVLGNARPPSAGPSLRERTAAALRALKGDAQAMRKYDVNGDGVICQEEWETARADVEGQILQAKLHGTQQAPQADLVTIGKAGSAPFIIAETESEARLAQGYGRAVLPLLAAGIALAALAATLFLQTFGIL